LENAAKLQGLCVVGLVPCVSQRGNKGGTKSAVLPGGRAALNGFQVVGRFVRLAGSFSNG